MYASQRYVAAALFALVLFLRYWVSTFMNCEEVKALVVPFGEHSVGCRDAESHGTSVVSSTFKEPSYLAARTLDGPPIPVVSTASQIPKILHQTFMSRADVPVKYVGWMQTWLHELGGNWTFVYWTDTDVRQFVAAEYPHLLELFDGYTKNILRVDMVRYLILHRYGGVYADVDFELLSSLEPALAAYPVMLLDSPHKDYEDVQNSLMASAPRHPFWEVVVQTLLDRRPSPEAIDIDILAATGPGMLSEAARRWREQPQHASRGSPQDMKRRGRRAPSEQLMVDDIKRDGVGIGRFGATRFLEGLPSTDGPAVALHHYSHRWLWDIKRENIRIILSWVMLLYSASWVLIELVRVGRQASVNLAAKASKDGFPMHRQPADPDII